MAQYIDKDAVDTVLRKLWKKDNGLSNAVCNAYNKALQDIQCEIDTLEVKEVNLDESARKWEDKVYLEKGWQDEFGTPHAPFSEIGNAFKEGAKFILKASISEQDGFLTAINGISVKNILAWLEKQGEKGTADKIQLGKKYKCIASPRYTTFMLGKIYKPEDKFLCRLMNFCSDGFEPIEDGEQKPAEWSDRDWYFYSKLESFLEVKDHYSPTESSSGYQKDVHETLIWLKSLRPNKYVTWSEEDERNIKGIIDEIEANKNNAPYYDLATYDRFLSWLKSIKGRVQSQSN